MAIEGVRIALVGALETFDLDLFLHHGLDRADAGEVLLHVGAEVGEAVLHLPRGEAHLAGGP